MELNEQVTIKYAKWIHIYAGCVFKDPASTIDPFDSTMFYIREFIYDLGMLLEKDCAVVDEDINTEIYAKIAEERGWAA